MEWLFWLHKGKLHNIMRVVLMLRLISAHCFQISVNPISRPLTWMAALYQQTCLWYNTGTIWGQAAIMCHGNSDWNANALQAVTQKETESVAGDIRADFAPLEVKWMWRRFHDSVAKIWLATAHCQQCNPSPRYLSVASVVQFSSSSLCAVAMFPSEASHTNTHTHTERER